MLRRILLFLAKRFHKKWYCRNQMPKAVILEDARGKHRVDVRNFFVNPNVFELEQVAAQYKHIPENIRINLIKAWILANIKAKPEKGEFWKFPFETLKDKEGDCEDLAILFANLLIASGIESWRVRLCAGLTDAGAHVWVEWFDGQAWRNLDFFGYKPIEVWYCWDSEYAYTRKENIEKWRKK